MSTIPYSDSQLPYNMKQRLHDMRRAEVFGRFMQAMEPVDPAQAIEWETVRIIAFNAAYDYYDATGAQDAHEYAKGKKDAIEAMMDFHLVGDIESAEEELMLMDDIARDAASEVHANDYDRERMHSVANRHLPRISPKHDPMVGSAHAPRPFVENVPAPRPTLSLTHQPQKSAEPSLAERTKDFFHEQNSRYWNNHALTREMKEAYKSSSIGPEDVDLALYEGLKKHRIQVTHVPQAGDYAAPAADVMEFLETYGLAASATHVWLLHQMEDKYVALASEVAQGLGITPGRLRPGDLANFDAEFAQRYTPFKHDLIDAQEIIMNGLNREEFLRDTLALEMSLNRTMEHYLGRGPQVDGQGRGV